MFWVCVAHVLVLLLAIFLAHVLTPTPPPEKLIMVNLGNEENVNPAEGRASAKQRGPANPNPNPQPATAPPTPTPPQPQPTPPVTPPQPTPPQPPVVQPTPTPPEPVVKNDFPTETTSPPKPKPTKVKVEANLNPVSRSNTVKANTSTTVQRSASSSSSNGISASTVERSLSNALGGGGDPTAGVPGGRGPDGSPGSRTGNPNGDWYRTLIKNTIERRWMKPQSTNPNLTATVRIRVLADGTIEYLGLTSGSGDTEMDNSVISAVRNAGKVSMPPPDGFPKPYEDTVIFRLKGDM